MTFPLKPPHPWKSCNTMRLLHPPILYWVIKLKCSETVYFPFRKGNVLGADKLEIKKLKTISVDNVLRFSFASHINLSYIINWLGNMLRSWPKQNTSTGIRTLQSVNPLSLLIVRASCLYALWSWLPLFLHLPALWQHNLVDEVDDGRGRLFGVQLCKQVANILCQAAGLLGYETEHPEKKRAEKEDVREEEEAS